MNSIVKINGVHSSFLVLSSGPHDPAKRHTALGSLMQRDPEGWARLKGLISQLALPPVMVKDVGAVRPNHVHVQTPEGHWMHITDLYLDEQSGALVFAKIIDGETVWSYSIRFDETIPPWRLEKIPEVPR